MKCIEALKSRLSLKNTLVAQNEAGCVDEVVFEWNAPITDNEMRRIINENNLVLPDEYLNFFKISNGAVLFKDMEYGQWGCRLLSLQDMLKVTNQKLVDMGYELATTQFVLSTWIGDSDFLLIDTEKLSDGKYIIDCEGNDPIEYGTILKWDFEDWLDYLIVAQGAKFWRW